MGQDPEAPAHKHVCQLATTRLGTPRWQRNPAKGGQTPVPPGTSTGGTGTGTGPVTRRQAGVCVRADHRLPARGKRRLQWRANGSCTPCQRRPCMKLRARAQRQLGGYRGGVTCASAWRACDGVCCVRGAACCARPRAVPGWRWSTTRARECLSTRSIVVARAYP